MKRPFTVVSVTALFTSSCQKDDPVDYDKNKWDSHEYLDISGGANASNMTTSIWTSADMKALYQADTRATTKQDENGFLSIKEKSAEELNISPRLYEVLQRIIDNTNDFRSRMAAKINYSLPLTKSGSIEEGEGERRVASDCVAQTICAALAQYGITANADDINKQLEEKYGVDKGVPANMYTKELRKYLKGRETVLSVIPQNYKLDKSSENLYLLGLKMANFGGHAATFHSFAEDGWINVRDTR